jgi:curved DNA-binding protein CbpA
MAPTEMHDRPNWYSVLGVKPSATFVEIRAAYRRQALALHADRLRSAETPTGLDRVYDRLNELGDAYRVLRHPNTRGAYDLARENHSSPLPDSVRKSEPALPRYKTRARRPGENRRRLGRVAVVLGFGLLVLWAVVVSIADRRQAAASMLSSPSGIANAPVSER